MRFLTDTDYDVLLRDEIRDILLENNHTDSKLHRAEDMAISQIKGYLAGRYDIEAIFNSRYIDEDTDTRNAFIVMITIDCALYHLYTSLAPNKIPEHRGNRYGDALDWLKTVGKGEASADLPRAKDSTGNEYYGIKITSEYPNEDNRW